MLVVLMLLSMMPTTVFATVEDESASSTDVIEGTEGEVAPVGNDGTITYDFVNVAYCNAS